jgi:hypothetical protein
MASAEPTVALDQSVSDASWIERVPKHVRSPVLKSAGYVAERLQTDAIPLLLISCMAMVWTVQLPMQIAADSWLNLLGGREIMQHGLPHHDALAVVSHGSEWIDQQWLANLAFYGLYRVGGMPLVAHVNTLFFVASVAVAFVIARRRGASAVAVGVCGLPLLLMAYSFVRAEVLVQPLFVLMMALLSAESRRPTARVFLAFPILVIWANLHGSVLIGAALVALLGGSEVVSLLHSRRVLSATYIRPATLLTLPWLCVFASPYGFDLTAYYRATIGNPEFAKALSEWRAPAPLSVWGFALIFGVALASFLIARRPRALTPFELGALMVTLLAAISSARSIVWFSYAGVLILPQLMNQPRRFAAAHMRERLGAAAIVTSVGAVLIVGHSLIDPPKALAHERQRAALPSIERALRTDSSTRVFASYDLADWLLFRLPEVRGRIAYDGRWEILAPSEMARLVRYLRMKGSAWEVPSVGYRLLVLNPKDQKELVAAYAVRDGVRTLYRNKDVVVFDRGVAAEGGRNP